MDEDVMLVGAGGVAPGSKEDGMWSSALEAGPWSGAALEGIGPWSTPWPEAALEGIGPWSRATGPWSEAALEGI